MSLVHYATARVGRAASRVAKLAGAYLAASVLLLVGIGYASTAAVMALETAIGPAGARFVLAAFYMLCGAGIIVAMRWRENSPSAPASEKEQSAGETPRALNLAMLVEALMLGFSMSSSRASPRKPPTRRRR